MVAVEGPTVARVTSFTLRGDDGTTTTFEVETLSLDEGGKPAPHLREHLVNGEPIEVQYFSAGHRRVAIRYRDAP